MSSSSLLSLPRMTTLIASLLCALGSGTNYVFSAYGPQLGSRLHVSHTRLNMVGLAGNIGVYSTAPFLGHFVDKHGPRYLLVPAFILLLTGYLGVRSIYDDFAPEPGGAISTFTFTLLVICSYMTGAGGNGGLASSVNATAKSFPDRARATATGIVLSGFGLSAFFFSTLSHTLFKGNTSDFILLLALGTSIPMVIGFLFIRTIPLPTHELFSGAERGHNPPVGTHGTGLNASEGQIAGLYAYTHNNGSHAPLLASSLTIHEQNERPKPFRDISEDELPLVDTSLESSPTRNLSPETQIRPRSRSTAPSRLERSLSRGRHGSFGDVVKILDGEHLPNIHGVRLWASGDFWLMFIVITLLSGTGLMYINNAGAIAQALFAKGNPDYSDAQSSQWQAAQVSSISITNFAGRILLGVISDFTKNKLHLPRSYCMSLVALLFIISQVMVLNTTDVTVLWRSSLALGLAYGGMFGLFPSVSIDWFGLTHFSENWGTLSLSPLIGGNLLGIAFGRNLDRHAASSPLTTSTPKLGSLSSGHEHQCFEGRSCYLESLHITIGACCLALGLCLWAAIRDRRRMRKIEEEGGWEEREE